MTKTTDDGIFSFAGLAAGAYTVRIESPGFKVTEVNCRLTQSEGVGLDVTLDVGGVSETVSIVSGASTLQLASLSLSGRSYMSLARTQAGTTSAGGSGVSASGRNGWRDGDLAPKLDAALADLPADAVVAVQVWLVAKSPEVLAKLRALGFELVRDVKGRNRIVGRVPARRLAELAALADVRYVAKA